MAEPPEDFIDREAEESDEEEMVPKKKAKMGKLLLADSDADSSEEEEIEDEAQIREEMRGFVVDDREAEAEAEKQKSHSSSSSSDEDEVADDDLDDDDIDLIQENLNIRVSRHKPKKRVVMMESDDEGEEAAGGSADRVKETIAQQIFENDADERAPPTPSAAQQGAAKRAAREKEREKDALIVRGDEEEEEEEDAEEDLDDFIVDESGRPVSEKNRRRQVVHNDAALQEAQDIFGIDFDFDDDEVEKEAKVRKLRRKMRLRARHRLVAKATTRRRKFAEEYSDEEDMGDFEDERQARGAARRGKPAYAMFDPADLERSFLTEADQKIRAKDEPERFQLRHVEVDFVKEPYGGDINEEADWIFRHYFVEPPLSRQFVYFEPGHPAHSASAAAAADSGNAAPPGAGGQGDPEEIEAVPMDEYLSRKNSDNVLTSIRETLNNIRFHQLEVPFIHHYRKEQCVELDSRDLWTIFRADEQYTQLKRRRMQLSRLFERMRDYLASLTSTVDSTNAPSEAEPDVFAASGTRTLTERDVQRVREAGTHEQLADNYKFFALHYAHLLGPMKRFEVQRRAEKRERSKAERAAKRNRKLRDADGEAGDGDDDAEADADEEDEPDMDEEERSASDSRMQKLAVRRDAVWFSRQAGLGRFVAYFGLSVEEFGENMRENYARHETRQYPVEPLEAARDFVGGRFANEEDVVKAARVLFARQVAADPDVRHAARVAYFERAHVRMRPTRKGMTEIDERHPLASIKYLKPMPVRELRAADLLEMVRAAKDGLVTWEFTLDELGDASRRLSSAFEEYCALFKRDEQTPLVALWNIERRLVLDYAFNKLLFPEFARALQTKLATEAREGIARRYAASLARQLRVAPYAPPELRNTEEFDPARGRYARVVAIAFADRDQVPFAVCIDSDGQVGRDVRLEGLLRRPAGPQRDNEQDKPSFPFTGREASRRADQRAEERSAEQAIARLKAFIAREKPHVIAITAESVAALNIRERVERIVDELRTEREQHAARGGGDEALRHVPVEIVDNELSVLFAASKRGLSEFKDRPPVLRQAVSLARRLQDPLLEFIQLWNADEELLTLRLDPQQDSLPRDELATRVLNEILDAVALVGCDVNRALNSPYYAPIFTFISGLGPRKAYHVLRKLKAEHRRLENRTELVTKCGLTRRVCTNAFGFIHIDTKNLTEQTDNYVEVLDSTRVHVEAYDWARKMAVDALEYDDADGDAGGNARRERDEANPAQALEEVMGAPERLRDLDLDAFAEELERQGFGNKRITLYDIRQELTRPFAELRRPRVSLRSVPLLYALVKESRESLHVGSLVEANVTGIAFRKLSDEERAKPPRSTASAADGTTPQYVCTFCRRVFVDRPPPTIAGALAEPQSGSNALGDYWAHLDLATSGVTGDEACPGVPSGVRVRLYNGLDGYIPLKLLSSTRVEDPRERVRIGMQVRGRVVELRVNEPPPGTRGRSSLSVTLTTRSTDLRDEKHEYRPSRHDYYDDDAERTDENREQELKARAPVASFVPRVIVHANFANVKLADVAERLRACEPGEVIFRPSRLSDRLILTWKVDDTFDVLDHVDIREEDKPNAFSLGRRLYISKYKSGEREAEEAFEDLDEIVARYVQPMAAYARDILAHRYYVRDRALANAPAEAPLAPLEQLLRAEKAKTPSRIPYCFSVARDARLTGKFCLSYLPNRSVRHEYLTPTPDGIRFRNIIHSTLDRLIAWFKEHYNEPPPEVDAPGASPAGSDFSRISMRTTDSDLKARQLQRSRADHASTAQLEAAAASRQRSTANVKPFPLGTSLSFGTNAASASTTGSRNQQPVVIDDDEPQSQPTFRRPTDAPPRRGCFNCGQDGHMARECPRPRNADRGRGAGRGSSRACYKCNEEGHMAVDCPQAGARGQSSRGRGGSTPGGWSSRSGDRPAAASGGSGWGAQASSSSGSGWSSSTTAAARSNDSGWSAAAPSTTPKHTTPSASASASRMQTDDESWDDGPAAQPSRSTPSAAPPAPINDARRNDEQSWNDDDQPMRAAQQPLADGDSWDDPPAAGGSTTTAPNASFSSQMSQSQMPLHIDESAPPMASQASQLAGADDWDDPPAPSASKTPVSSWTTASKQPAAPAEDDWGDEPSGGKSQPSAGAAEQSAGSSSWGNSSGAGWGSKPSGNDAGDGGSAASGGSAWGRRPSGDAEPSSGTGWGSSGTTGGWGSGSGSSSGGWGDSGSRGARGGRGGGRGGCFNCGQDGHMSRDCPNPRSERGRGGSGSGSGSGSGGAGRGRGGCFNCGEDGHMSRDCPNPRSERGRGGSGGGGGAGRGRGGCFNCGEDGHMSRDCPKPRSERGRGGRGGRGGGSSGSGWGGGSSSGWGKSSADASASGGDSGSRSSGWGASNKSGRGDSSSPAGGDNGSRSSGWGASNKSGWGDSSSPAGGGSGSGSGSGSGWGRTDANASSGKTPADGSSAPARNSEENWDD